MGNSDYVSAADSKMSVPIIPNEDACKRRWNRSKPKGLVDKALRFPIHYKNSKFRACMLKILLAITVCGMLATVAYHPDVYISQRSPSPDARPSLVQRWIWGSEEEDRRYVSDLDIVWDDVRDITGRNMFRNIGLLNFNGSEVGQWKALMPSVDRVEHLHLDRADKNVTWDVLYPEWIDEEEESEIPKCPELPKPKDPGVQLDLIVVKLPCRNEWNWSRDVARLHLQLAAATFAAEAKGKTPIHVLFITRRFPMPNLFPCKELVVRKGHSWLYRPNLDILREKLQLPVGSCELALPLRANGIARNYKGNPRREAYVTILHSAHVHWGESNWTDVEELFNPTPPAITTALLS
ncbi:hypothetical protein MLD38_028434 [Melastoma candidum]|uniref:Uncharacterized protein n=1 Tax=Melastoma candidum TaxID=119954 RepID=A0ACB9N384_9MYRT|nr:hypothetical protein MLD38_028434 [Melastoma candidum]